MPILTLEWIQAEEVLWKAFKENTEIDFDEARKRLRAEMNRIIVDRNGEICKAQEAKAEIIRKRNAEVDKLHAAGVEHLTRLEDAEGRIATLEDQLADAESMRDHYEEQLKEATQALKDFEDGPSLLDELEADGHAPRRRS